MLRDVAGDESMPEIQGYFRVLSTGRLHAHFSFLTATPKEELNIALAGPRFFQLEKDGIAFWLKSDRGRSLRSGWSSVLTAWWYDQ